MYELRLEIPWLPKSLNCALRAGRFKNNSQNKAWDNYIFLATRGKCPPAPLQKAKIKIIRHYYRTLDFDGLVGSLKPVVDALVDARILLDDSWGVLGAWEVDQRFKAKSEGPLLEIFIQEIK